MKKDGEKEKCINDRGDESCRVVFLKLTVPITEREKASKYYSVLLTPFGYDFLMTLPGV